MQLRCTSTVPTTYDGDLLVLGRVQDAAPSPAERAIDEALGGALSSAAARLRFRGASEESVGVDTGGRLPAHRVVLLGLGGDDLNARRLRELAALAYQQAEAGRWSRIGVVLPGAADARVVHDLAAGLHLAAYHFDAFKSADPDRPRHAVAAAELLTPGERSGVEDALKRARHLAAGVNLARHLADEPPNACTPTRMAEAALELAERTGLTCRIIDREEMGALGMGGLISVAQGGEEPPKLIHLTYEPAGGAADGGLAFVGKGVTFDSGGLSLKPPKSMEDMYRDMAGGAAVLGALSAIAELRPAVRVHGIIGATENMPSGHAYRPSDILRMYNGKTVEVLNTDAEGRLVLADALHYAVEQAPTAIVDVATLTGACMVGLGPNYGGLFASHDALAQEIQTAAEVAGELLWRLPLDPELKEVLKSKRADLKNVGGRYGGSITAALFLAEFVGELPWAHLDIAGPALGSKADGASECCAGIGVLTLVSMATRRG